MVIWYIFPRFGMLNQEKSGNPGHRFGSKEFRSLLWFQVAFISFNRNVYMIQGHKNYGSKGWNSFQQMDGLVHVSQEHKNKNSYIVFDQIKFSS
jgi:hypothetical protein